MRFELDDLPPELRKQALRKLAEEERLRNRDESKQRPSTAQERIASRRQSTESQCGAVQRHGNESRCDEEQWHSSAPQCDAKARRSVELHRKETQGQCAAVHGAEKQRRGMEAYGETKQRQGAEMRCTVQQCSGSVKQCEDGQRQGNDLHSIAKKGLGNDMHCEGTDLSGIEWQELSPEEQSEAKVKPGAERPSKAAQGQCPELYSNASTEKAMISLAKKCGAKAKQSIDLHCQAMEKHSSEKRGRATAEQSFDLQSEAKELRSAEGQSGAKAKQSCASESQAKAELSQAKQYHATKSKQNKYNAQKETVILPDGTVQIFDSKKEARIYSELLLLEQSGEISGLQTQVPFELIPRQVAPSRKIFRPCTYIADFVFMNNENGNEVVLDVKSPATRTPAYRIKKKLMLKVWGIEITEV